MSLPNIGALLTPLLQQAQDLEDATYGLILGRALPWARGVVLDKVVAIVGQARSASGPDATDDDAYRSLIYARIYVNTSNGTPETVYSLLRAVGATGALIREPWNYAMAVQFTGTLLLSDDALRSAIEQATPPVSLSLTEYQSAPFGFAGTPGALGFGAGKLARTIP